jgi:Putative mono-oxygenase ydhR
MDMSAKVLQINYRLVGPRAAYEAENVPYAQPIADMPGLRWKVWIVDEARGEAGGIYLFDDDGALQSFLDGPIIAEMKGDPTLSIKAFDVIARLTAVTRGPVT